MVTWHTFYGARGETVKQRLLNMAQLPVVATYLATIMVHAVRQRRLLEMRQSSVTGRIIYGTCDETATFFAFVGVNYININLKSKFRRKLHVCPTSFDHNIPAAPAPARSRQLE